MGLEQIPSVITTGITKQIGSQMSALSTQLTAVSNVSNAIPEGAACDSQEIAAALAQIQNAQEQIAKIQKMVTTVNTIINTVQALAVAAQAIKAIQLGNPVTGAAAAASEIMMTQALLISNVLGAVKGLASLPTLIDATVSSAQAGLASAIANVSAACPEVEIPVDQGTADEIDNNELDTLENTLNNALADQEALRISIEEAPSKVYQGVAVPDVSLGKPADYFIDNQNKRIYGPKPNRTSWGDGIKFE